MLTGSRLGRRRSWCSWSASSTRCAATPAARAPLSIGVYSLSITAVAYLPGRGRSAGGCSPRATSTASTSPPRPGVVSVTDELFGWLPDLLRDVVPGWSLFPIGVVVLLGAFACFDRVLPDGRLRPLRARPASPTRG